MLIIEMTAESKSWRAEFLEATSARVFGIVGASSLDDA
jgi:hypothetical protein